MASVVTVVGAHSQVISLQYDSTQSADLAQRVANAIGASIANGSMVASSDTAGAPAPLPAGKSGEYDQTRSGVERLSAGYVAAVVTAPSPVLFGSGATGEMILAGDTSNLTFYATAGSGTVAAGGGNNLLSIAVTDTGSWAFAAGDGNNTVAALGSGNDTVMAGGGNNAVTLGGGASSVVSAGYDTITAGAGSETINAATAGSDLIYGGSSGLLFLGGAGPATILGGTGADTFLAAVSGSPGPQVVYGGTGGPNELVAGAGAATLFGGAGNDTFQGGSGNATLVGGANVGTDKLLFVKGSAGGSDLVMNYYNSADVHIVLSGYDTNEVTNALAAQTSTASSVTIGLSDGTHITFQNLTHLTSSNFS